MTQQEIIERMDKIQQEISSLAKQEKLTSPTKKRIEDLMKELGLLYSQTHGMIIHSIVEAARKYLKVYESARPQIEKSDAHDIFIVDVSKLFEKLDQK